MIKNNYLIGSKNESFGPGGIQNAITDTLIRTKGAVDAKLINKNINENGIYKAKDDDADGYSSVKVDVIGENNAKFIYTVPTQYFSMHNIKSIVIPEGCIGVSGGAFSSCQLLDSVTLPTTLESIGQKAFSACQGLTSIEIPASVTTISSEAFLQCTNMQTIIVNKPEGSISGAPWGATNAEVIWTG